MRTGIPNVRGIGTSQQALDALPVADVPKELQGAGGCGTVFKLDKTGKVTVLHRSADIRAGRPPPGP